MRDIKFRVWNGEAMITENVVFLGKSGFAIDLDGMDWDFEFGRFGKPELVGMQYTGLKDKNGVEIYKGDILNGNSRVFGDLTGRVDISEYSDNEEYMHETHFGWNVNGIPLIDLVNDNLEVIGNIHQNPELLEQK